MFCSGFLCLKLSVNILFYVRVIFLILPYSVVFFFVYKSLPFFLWCMTVRNADFFFSPDNSFFEKDNFNVYNNKTCKRIEFRLLSVQASGSSASSPCTRRTMASPCGAGGAGGRTGHFPCGRGAQDPPALREEEEETLSPQVGPFPGFSPGSPPARSWRGVALPPPKRLRCINGI